MELRRKIENVLTYLMGIDADSLHNRTSRICLELQRGQES